MKDSSVYKYEINFENKNFTPVKELELIGFDKKVLEFGCSVGHVSKIMKERGCTVTGIEIDGHAAKKAEGYCERVIVADIETIDFNKELSDEKFDIALFGDILEHLKTPKTILLKVKDFLKENGYIVISIPNIAHWSIRLDLLCGKFDYQELGILDDTHLRFFTKSSIINLLESCGYYMSSIDEVRQDVDWVKVSTIMRLKGLNDADIKNFSSILNDPEAGVFQYVIKAIPSAESEYLKKISAEKCSLEERILNLEGQITNISGQLDEKEQQINELNAAILGKDERIPDLEVQIGDISSQLSEKEQQMNDLNVAVHGKDAQMRDLEEQIADISAHLKEKDVLINELNVAISDKTEGILRLEEELGVKDKQISELNVAISDKTEGILRLEEELGVKDKQISELNVAISDKTEGILRLEEELEVKDKQISELNVAISDKTEGILRLEEELEVKDKQISELNVAISDKTGGILRLEEELEVKDKQISELNVAISDKTGGILRLEEELGVKDKQISELNVAISDKAEGIRRLEEEINTMLQLKSVRLHRKIEAVFKKVRLRRQKEN